MTVMRGRTKWLRVPASLVEQSWSCCFPVAAGQRFIVRGKRRQLAGHSLPLGFLPTYLFGRSDSIES